MILLTGLFFRVKWDPKRYEDIVNTGDSSCSSLISRIRTRKTENDIARGSYLNLSR